MLSDEEIRKRRKEIYKDFLSGNNEAHQKEIQKMKEVDAIRNYELMYLLNEISLFQKHDRKSSHFDGNYISGFIKNNFSNKSDLALRYNKELINYYTGFNVLRGVKDIFENPFTDERIDSKEIEDKVFRPILGGLETHYKEAIKGRFLPEEDPKSLINFLKIEREKLKEMDLIDGFIALREDPLHYDKESYRIGQILRNKRDENRLKENNENKTKKEFKHKLKR